MGFKGGFKEARLCSGLDAVRKMGQLCDGVSFYKKKYFILFLERGSGEKERERNINVWLPLEYPTLGT